jgi:hypothetical protein
MRAILGEKGKLEVGGEREGKKESGRRSLESTREFSRGCRKVGGGGKGGRGERKRGRREGGVKFKNA